MNKHTYFLAIAFLGSTFMTPKAESATECKNALEEISKSVADIGKVVTESANRVGGLKGELKGRAVRTGLKAGIVGFFGGSSEDVVKQGAIDTAKDLKNDAKKQADKLKEDIKKIKETAACGAGKFSKLLSKKKGKAGTTDATEATDDQPAGGPTAFYQDHTNPAPLLFTSDPDTPVSDAPADSSAGGQNDYDFTKELGDLEGADNSMADAASKLANAVAELANDPENPDLIEKLNQAADEAEAQADSVIKEADDVDPSILK